MQDGKRGFEPVVEFGFERCFELLQAGDADGLREILEHHPAADARGANGVSLIMHALYRGRRDLADLIARKKKALDIFEAASLGRIERLQECIREAHTRDASAIKSSRDSRSLDSPLLDCTSNDGFTALHFACFFGQPEAARVL